MHWRLCVTAGRHTLKSQVGLSRRILHVTVVGIRTPQEMDATFERLPAWARWASLQNFMQIRRGHDDLFVFCDRVSQLQGRPWRRSQRRFATRALDDFQGAPGSTRRVGQRQQGDGPPVLPGPAGAMPVKPWTGDAARAMLVSLRGHCIVSSENISPAPT